MTLAAARLADMLQRISPVRLPLSYEPPYILKSMPRAGTDQSRTRAELGVSPRGWTTHYATRSRGWSLRVICLPKPPAGLPRPEMGPIQARPREPATAHARPSRQLPQRQTPPQRTNGVSDAA